MMNKHRLLIPPPSKRCRCSWFRCLSLSFMANNPSFHHQKCFCRMFLLLFCRHLHLIFEHTGLCCHCPRDGLGEPPFPPVECSFFYPLSQTHLFTLTRRGRIKIALVRVVSSSPALCWGKRGSFLTFRLVEGKPLTIMAAIMGRLTKDTKNSPRINKTDPTWVIWMLHTQISQRHVSSFISPEVFASRCSAILFASLQQYTLDPLITDAAPRLSSGDTRRLPSYFALQTWAGSPIHPASVFWPQLRPVWLLRPIIRPRHRHHLTETSASPDRDMGISERRSGSFVDTRAFILGFLINLLNVFRKSPGEYCLVIARSSSNWSNQSYKNQLSLLLLFKWGQIAHEGWVWKQISQNEAVEQLKG